MKSLNGSIPRRSNLSTQVQAGEPAAQAAAPAGARPGLRAPAEWGYAPQGRDAGRGERLRTQINNNE